MDISILIKYFDFSQKQLAQFKQLSALVLDKNLQVNLISRKDTNHLWEKHILHSLSLYHWFGPNLPACSALDVGTGGGFPGLPLAIAMPQVQFTLIDTIGKKIAAVKHFTEELQLDNVTATQCRAQNLKTPFDFIISRAVTNLPAFTKWVWKNQSPGKVGDRPKGIAYLRGLDFDIDTINQSIHPGYQFSELMQLGSIFDEAFFSTKNIVFLRRI